MRARFDYPARNREKTRAPKQGKCWCFGCDMFRVGDGARCPVCGRRHGHRRLKKQGQYLP